VAADGEFKPIEARLSAFDISMVVFSLVVGIGIFRTPAIVANAAGDTRLFYAAWIAGGLISLVVKSGCCSSARPCCCRRLCSARSRNC
jgi:hypothetical protein